MILWLSLFLVVAVAVQARQAAAIATAKRVAALKEQHTALESERSDLQHRIRLATSRRTLGDKAEGLGLHLPEDSEFLYLNLTRPAR